MSTKKGDGPRMQSDWATRRWMMVKILLVILSLTVMVIVLTFTLKGPSTTTSTSSPMHDPSISVILLNHLRPHNLDISLPILSTYPEIQEIVVLHGVPDTMRNTASTSSHCTIKHVEDFEHDAQWGATRRYFASHHAKGEILLFLDDDLLPPRRWIQQALGIMAKHAFHDNIYGSTLRVCSARTYNTWTWFRDQTPDRLILPNCALVPKTTVLMYMTYGFPRFREWLQTHHGNGDDLAFGLFVRYFYGRYPIWVPGGGSIRRLDERRGYHARKHHYRDRARFCQQFVQAFQGDGYWRDHVAPGSRGGGETTDDVPPPHHGHTYPPSNV